MQQSFIINTRKQNDLSTKITMLKRSVFVLLNEVKRLEAMPLADVSQGIDLGDELRWFEIHLIRRALEETGGHQVHDPQNAASVKNDNQPPGFFVFAIRLKTLPE